MNQYDIPDFIKNTTIKDLILIDNQREKEKEKTHPLSIITESDILNEKADPFYMKNDESFLLNKTTYSYFLDDYIKKEEEEEEDNEQIDDILLKIYKDISLILTFLQLSKPMPREIYDSYVTQRRKFEKYTTPILKKSLDIYKSIELSLKTIDEFIKR